MSAPAVQRLGPAVLLQGAALAEVQHLLILGIRARAQRDAIHPSPALVNLLAVVSDAVAATTSNGMTPPRHGDVAPGAPTPELITPPVGTSEAARLLGLGIRQTQRLAADLGGYRVAGRLVFDRAAVIAYAAARTDNEENTP